MVIRNIDITILIDSDTSVMSGGCLEQKLPISSTRVAPHEKEVPISVKFLDTVVATVYNIAVALGIEGQFGRQMKSVRASICLPELFHCWFGCLCWGGRHFSRKAGGWWYEGGCLHCGCTTTRQ